MLWCVYHTCCNQGNLLTSHVLAQPPYVQIHATTPTNVQALRSTTSPSNTDPNESSTLLSPDATAHTLSDKHPPQSASSSNVVSAIPATASLYTSSNLFRTLAFVTTSVHFALALQLSNLTDPLRVVSFLLLPWHRAFDPSLAALAVGALPLAIVLYKYGRGGEVPVCGGKWSIPKGGSVDWRLVGGAAMFGVGWGITGVCRECFCFCLRMQYVETHFCSRASTCEPWTRSRSRRKHHTVRDVSRRPRHRRLARLTR